VDALSLLLAWGGDMNIHGQSGATPLLVAIRLPSLACAKFLIQNGADLDKATTADFTCLEQSVSRIAVPVEYTRLLLRHGADVVLGGAGALNALSYTLTDPTAVAIPTQRVELLLSAPAYISTSPTSAACRRFW
jgi:hypothetical protein